MGKKTNIIAGSLLGAIAIHLALIACSGSSTPRFSDGGSNFEDVVDAMAAGDIGAAIDAAADVVQGVRDAEVRDAHAGGRVVEASCTEQSVSRFTSTTVADGGAPTYVQEATTWYAVLPGVTANPREAPLLTAYTCDRETFGTPAGSCPMGFRCETTGFAVDTPCQQVGAFIASDGRVVVNCGYRSRTTVTNESGTTTSDTGSRGRTVYARVQ